MDEFNITNLDSKPLFNQYNTYVYEPTCATEFYEILEKIQEKNLSREDTYKTYREILNTILNQKTSKLKDNLSSPIQKLDYLLSNNDVSESISSIIRLSAISIRNYKALSNEDFNNLKLRDLQGLCFLINLIYEVEIPKILSSKFPKAQIKQESFSLASTCVRMIVSFFDDNFFYGHIESSNYNKKVKVSYITSYKDKENKDIKFNWSYLKRFFYIGCQVNLVHPKEISDGEIMPELIIFEPDYLLDITTVARCFESYACSAFVNLIKKFLLSEPTYHTTLGNFASQLLDESINFSFEQRSYDEAVREFFSNNAIGLMTLDDKNRSQFHKDARSQRVNIYKAMLQDLPYLFPKVYDKELGILEPSFFSEMLGLQGRMDYLQLDFSILLEQKSGKSTNFQNFRHPIKAVEQHYVQCLLYMLLIKYNYSENFKANNECINAFLLYSKYEESLLSVSINPRYMFDAIRVRNEIAWHEILFSKEDGYRILEEISADDLNMKGVTGTLWEKYQKPQIEKVLDTIHNAPNLEKTYFYRFLSFISLEHMLSKIGGKTKEDSGFAQKWHNNLEEKLLQGDIYSSLKLIFPDSLDIKRTDILKFSFLSSQDFEISNFRVGDIVIAYPYSSSSEPDLRKTIVFRATIQEQDSSKITLRLRAMQSNIKVFLDNKDKPWAIEHDFMESSYSSQYQAMFSFLEAPQKRRDLLLFQREPEIQQDVKTLLGNDYGEFSQLVLRVQQAKDIFLIIGPPGTGKTSFGLMTNLKEELLHKDASVLLMAYTNRAVDEICEKLMDENIDFIRIGKEATCSKRFHGKLIGNKIANIEKLDDVIKLMTSVRVLVGTTTTMNSHLTLLKMKQFSLAIIDEASQILEPHLLSLFSANADGASTIKKFVLIGDHKQLPAIVKQTPLQSNVQNSLLNSIGIKDCRQSLFERFLNKYKDDKRVTYLLTKQGRMHKDIAAFPSYSFYAGKLDVVPLEHQEKDLMRAIDSENGIEQILKTRRVAFVGVDNKEDSLSDKVNTYEAEVIANFILKIYDIEKENFNAYSTVGIIVPYRNQISAIRNSIERQAKEKSLQTDKLLDITIDTVERFQGSERKYILYGFTAKKTYQLDFLTLNQFVDEEGKIVDRKLNVAMTRARESLILIGNPNLLSLNLIFFKLIEYLKSKNSFFYCNFNDIINGKFYVPKYEPIDMDISQAEYEVLPRFKMAYKKLVAQPLKDASKREWPKIVMGKSYRENMELIEYGRCLPSSLEKMDSKQNVLIYCHYLMRKNYCIAKTIFQKNSSLIKYKMLDNKRVQMIDFLSGPATSGLAFVELFLDDISSIRYVGIEPLSQMRKMAKKMLDEVFFNELSYKMMESFSELSSDYWMETLETPQTIIFNFSNFFSKVSPQSIEKLTINLLNAMKAYPLNKYIFIIQQDKFDTNLSSYNVFIHLLKDSVFSIKDEYDNFSCMINGKENKLDFYNTILEN